MLKICKTFFLDLNSEHIRYCHWKSNFHLDKALAGNTDLDLLVHADDKKAFEKILKRLSIKKILSVVEKRFPGLEDYLGFDHLTGDLIHLHVHYELVLGQRYIKNHHLPIEKLIFQNLILNGIVFVPCPEIELILLVIRAHMKVDSISLIKHAIKDLLRQEYSAFPKDIDSEFSDLINKSDIEKLKDLLIKTRLPLSEKLFERFISKFSARKLNFHHIVWTRWRILSELKRFRRCKGINIYLKYLSFCFRNLPGIRRFGSHDKKILPQGGKIFSFVGADGSGKSTLTKDIEDWLSWKLSVGRYYYGIPKTMFIQLLSYAMRFFSKFDLNMIAISLEYSLWLYIAKKRYSIFNLCTKDVLKGKAVITDRFPLKYFHNMAEPMDGPRINGASSRLGRFFSTLEKNYYDKLECPDTIFVLQVDYDELRRRKPCLNEGTHQIKAEAVNQIKEETPIILINADRPYPVVNLAIKRKIWESLF